MKSAPLVSILVVTWNRQNDLKRCLLSAQEQDYTNCEIIVLDNASEDGTSEMVQNQFPNVSYVRSAVNLGCPSGRNLGFKYCNGEIIYQLDDDGWLASDAISIIVERMQAEKNVGAVMSRIIWQDDVSKRDAPDSHGDQTKIIASFVGCCTALRKNLIDQIGGYPEGFIRQGEETHLSLRLLNDGFFCIYEPKSVMFHQPSPIGRNSRQHAILEVCNQIKTALELWPAPYHGLRSVWCVLKSIRLSVAFRTLEPLRAVISTLFREWGKVAKQPGHRRPVQSECFSLYRSLVKEPRVVDSEFALDLHQMKL